MGVLTLPEAQAHLNNTDPDDASEIESTIAAATAALVKRLGPIEPTSGMTCRVDGGGRGLLLPTGRAIASVDSVTAVGGDLLVMSDLYVNLTAGIVEYNSGAVFSARAYDIVYTGGYMPVPDDLVRAVMELVAHLWETQRGGVVPAGALPAEGDPIDVSMDVALPRRVLEMIHPYRRTGVR